MVSQTLVALLEKWTGKLRCAAAAAYIVYLLLDRPKPKIWAYLVGNLIIFFFSDALCFKKAHESCLTASIASEIEVLVVFIGVEVYITLEAHEKRVFFTVRLLAALPQG